MKAAGVPESILKMIPEVVHSCRECRAWLTPKPRTLPSLRVSFKFNEHVEMDLMFYNKEVIFHMIDRRARWHSACISAIIMNAMGRSIIAKCLAW